MKATSITFALGVLISACGVSDADDSSSSEDHLEAAGSILALGDSITYGLDPNITPEGAPTNRYKSYADELAGSGPLVNASCSGESSGSFLDASAPDNGCHKGDGFIRFLKTPWNKPSQVEFVKDYLAARVRENRPPRMVVITLGGNDLFMVSEGCNFVTCLPALFSAASKYQANMLAIFRAIASTGYKGVVAVPNIYALDFSATVEKVAIGKFNTALEKAAEQANQEASGSGMKVVLADVYGAWQKEANGGSSCAAGLLLPGAKDDGDDDDDNKEKAGAGAGAKEDAEKGDGDGDGDENEKECDVHPSEKGRKLIAQVVRDSAH